MYWYKGHKGTNSGRSHRFLFSQKGYGTAVSIRTSRVRWASGKSIHNQLQGQVGHRTGISIFEYFMAELSKPGT